MKAFTSGQLPRNAITTKSYGHKTQLGFKSLQSLHFRNSKEMGISLWNAAFLCVEVWVPLLRAHSSDKGKMINIMNITVPGISVPGTWQDNFNNIYDLHIYIFSTFLILSQLYHP